MALSYMVVRHNPLMTRPSSARLGREELGSERSSVDASSQDWHSTDKNCPRNDNRKKYGRKPAVASLREIAGDALTVHLN